MPTLPADLRLQAAGQLALITAAQFEKAAVPDKRRAAWVARGWIEPVQPRVWRLAGSPVTLEQRLLAAVLAAGPGAAASHRAAAWLWDLVADAPVEIVVPRGRTPRLWGAILHTSCDPVEAYHRRTIPVTTPMRSLVDLAAVVDAPKEVEDALDRGLVAGLFGVAAVEAELARLKRRGRAGAGRLQQVLDRRALDDKRADGLLEPRYARLEREYRLPPAVFQHEVRWGRRTYRIDFAYPDLNVAVEVDGYEKRATREAFQHDTERQTALAVLGWKVLRFTWLDLTGFPQRVTAEIAAATGQPH